MRPPAPHSGRSFKLADVPAVPVTADPAGLRPATPPSTLDSSLTSSVGHASSPPKKLDVNIGGKAGKVNVKVDTLDIIAVFAGLASLILASGMAFGKIAVSGTMATILVGLVGATAVGAYRGVDRRKGGK